MSPAGMRGEITRNISLANSTWCRGSWSTGTAATCDHTGTLSKVAKQKHRAVTQSSLSISSAVFRELSKVHNQRYIYLRITKIISQSPRTLASHARYSQMYSARQIEVPSAPQKIILNKRTQQLTENKHLDWVLLFSFAFICLHLRPIFRSE